jgi:hypothetical protein
MFNMYLVKREVLEAFDIDDIEQKLPDPRGKFAIKPPPNPKVELEKAKLDLQERQAKGEMSLQIQEMRQKAILDGAKVAELQAKAMKELSEAKGVETGQQIALLNAQIGAAKTHQDGVLKALELAQRVIDSRNEVQQGAIDNEHRNRVQDHAERMAGMEEQQGNEGTSGMAEGGEG